MGIVDSIPPVVLLLVAWGAGNILIALWVLEGRRRRGRKP